MIADAGGARELMRTSGAGRVVAREPKAFAGTIAELLAAPPAREAVRAAALPFTWEANAAALSDHLEQLLRTRTAPAG